MTTIEQEDQASRPLALVDLCRKALALIEQAQQEQPRHLSEDVDQSERALVRLRDRLIDHVRRESAAGPESHWREALKRTNAALSLVVGVEYPAGGLQRDMLKQAAGALQALLDAELLEGKPRD